MEKLREGDLYVDIGANVGYFSLLASRCVGHSGKVISIEADPVTFASLRKNLDLNGCTNVAARNVAATAAPCSVVMERDPRAYNSGSNRIRLGAGAGSVQGVPFRELVGTEVGRVRFIKIDIEGSEEPILSAILDALPDLPDDLIVATELSPGSAAHVERFVAAGFRASAVSNIYSIDYYLIRSYLERFGEGRRVHLAPIDSYDPAYTDYIFERGPTSPRIDGDALR